MKFIIERNAATTAVANVKAYIEKRNTCVILGNILIEADGAAVRFTGTDMDAFRTEAIAGEVSDPGAVTVPADALAKLLKEIVAGTLVECETEEDRLRIRAGRLSASLITLPAEDFPKAPALGAVVRAVTLPAGTLAEALRRVSFAISTEETRYYLNGIAFEFQAGALRLVATDCHRMAVADLPGIACKAKADYLPIMTRKVAAILAKSLKGKGPVTLTAHGAGPVFAIVDEHGTTIAKSIDGTFPDYTRVMPAGTFDGTLEYLATDAAAAIRRLKAVTSQPSVAIAINGAVTLRMRDPDTGEIEETIDGHHTGRDILIGVNANYLVEAAAAFGKDAAIKIGYYAPGDPFLMTSPDAPGLQVVQMPMRV